MFKVNHITHTKTRADRLYYLQGGRKKPLPRPLRLIKLGLPSCYLYLIDVSFLVLNDVYKRDIWGAFTASKDINKRTLLVERQQRISCLNFYPLYANVWSIWFWYEFMRFFFAFLEWWIVWVWRGWTWFCLYFQRFAFHLLNFEKYTYAALTHTATTKYKLHDFIIVT